jgi:hypothetical protein
MARPGENNLGADKATTSRKRGKRGQGRAQRRSIEAAARERHDAWNERPIKVDHESVRDFKRRINDLARELNGNPDRPDGLANDLSGGLYGVHRKNINGTPAGNRGPVKGWRDGANDKL